MKNNSKSQKKFVQKHSQPQIKLSESRNLLDPYRSIGNFVSGSPSISHTKTLSFAVPTLNSFKVYSQQLAIKVVSPSFQYPITSLATYNQITYVRTQNYIYKMKFHHCINKWYIPKKDSNINIPSTMLHFEGIIILSQGDQIYAINQVKIKQLQNKNKKQIESPQQIILQQYQIQSIKVSHQISRMIHPVTYINKILVYQKNEIKLTLVNPISQKIIYQFPKITQEIINRNTTISVIQSSTLTDIVAIGLNDGTILIANLKKDALVFQMKQKLPPISISFCSFDSLMASGDQIGHVIIWDLENKKLLFKMQNVFEKGSVNFLFFSQNIPLLTCLSSDINCIKQLKINRNDNKILTLHRQRVGLRNNIKSCKIMSNHDLILQSQTETMFMSIYSHTNNYLLPKCLDSFIPIHIKKRDFSVQIYNQRTLKNKFNIHQQPLIGKISISGQYYIVASKSKAYRLGQGQASQVKWNISGIKQIGIYNQHSIYFFTEKDLHVCDFNTEIILKSFENIGQCKKITLNHYGNYISFQNKTQRSIQVWQMSKIRKGRQFQNYDSNATCLAFTCDNQYLISTHQNKRIIIWNIANSQIYKTYILQQKLISLQFTPDNQFMISVGQNSKQAKIWINYIGKIPSSSQNNNLLHFKTKIQQILGQNNQYRKRLSKQFLKKVKLQEQISTNKEINYYDKILEEIPKVEDGLHQYQFQDISQISPLLYYDQIKERNTPNQSQSNVSLPFFLDFRNISQQKQKIQKQIQAQIKQKKNQYEKKKDKLLQNQSHQINLSQSSSQQDQINIFNMLKSISIAEIDYQMRKYLLNPQNVKSLLKMFKTVLKFPEDRQYKNIIFARALQIIGNSIFQQENTRFLHEINQNHQNWIQQQQKVFNKISVISENLAKTR